MEVWTEARDVCVACAGDESDRALVGAAARMARRARFRLRLAHVFTQGPLPMAPFPPDPAAGPQGAAAAAFEARRRTELIQHLDAMSMLADDAPYKVLEGNLETALLEHARELGARLVVIGAPRADEGVLDRFLSRAFALLAAADLPVMAIPRDGRPWLSGQAPLLAADDLSAQGLTALRAAARLALALGTPEVHHVHVAGTSLGRFDARLFEVYSTAAGHDERERALDSDQLIGLQRERLVQALGERRRAVQAASPEPVTIHSRLVEGAVYDGIEREAARCDAGVVVLGRHHAVHRRWPPFGKMSVRAMLRLERPILVVPEHDPPQGSTGGGGSS